MFPRLLAALALLALLALAGAGIAQERVSPRVGNHETYDRAVLDWPALVDYDVTVDGRDVRVVFARPVELDLAPMVRRMGSAASNPRTTIDATSGRRAKISTERSSIGRPQTSIATLSPSPNRVLRPAAGRMTPTRRSLTARPPSTSRARRTAGA